MCRPEQSASSPVARPKMTHNRPRSIYQYSNMAPRLSGQNCKFFNFLLSLNSQKRLECKENNTKYRSLTRKSRSHVRILIYRTWPIAPAGFWPQGQNPRRHPRVPRVYVYTYKRNIKKKKVLKKCVGSMGIFSI